MPEARVLAVGELTAYLQRLLANDGHLANVWVKGEISNLRCPASGHLYFSLKDRVATLRCVMFQGRSRSLALGLRDGLEVIARGQVAIYPRDGIYQLYVAEIFPAGMGLANLALQELTARLEREGLFAPDRKRPLPLLPRRVGLVTSPTGAALRDMITVSRRRFPGIGLLLAPARVQGETAPRQLALALELLGKRGGVDVIIIGRGGGSAEDLSAFNTEIVARAIYACPVPVIAAVGHETDLTLADRVADRRAPTPSAAAEMAVPVKAELERRLDILAGRARRGLEHRLEMARARLERLSKSRGLDRPRQELYYRQQYLDGLEQRLLTTWERRRSEGEQALKLLAARLEAASPLALLARGYAVCRRPGGGQPLKSSREVTPGERVEVILREGSLQCQVEDIDEAEERYARRGTADL
ncbi:exodeoxyribonuclease VII large subunit [Moorella sp. Hama-1]|uniref:exodeoxyribonuclease VII large subunit n=1 Tax=Moorella sp. Hama-1 TaxID=2138101 RepID=UPI000D65CEEB|nr:exodeoxyribonuclease VII large subunit [Moorella sp. Hama-1]BCV21775.1 exodeoxyribonuclease 7 large subunit [Moorella sp. Hama-1]